MNILIKICIFVFAIQGDKNIQAHHRNGFGKYVADDKAKVSVRSGQKRRIKSKPVCHLHRTMLDEFLGLSR